MTWSNWSGRQRSEPTRTLRPGSESELVEAVRLAGARGWSVRAVGESHSHSRVAAPDGLLVETDGWTGLVGQPTLDGDGQSLVRIRAGTRIHQLGEPLYRHGLALPNQGDIDRQSMAGAVSTGTHGTGPTLRNLTAAVAGVRLVLADGELVECRDDATADDESDLFEVARHSLGGVGLITELLVRVRPRYRLHERQWIAPPDEVLPHLDRLVAATRHFEFFWVPDRDLCVCKSLDEVAGGEYATGPVDPDEPIPEVEEVAKRERRGWSHQIFPSVRNDLHTEMEYGVPAELGPACFTELRQLIGDRFPELTWPLEYRTLAADDQLISVAAGRATVTISVHQDVALDDRPLFEACEEVFRAHEGRPHWGKAHHRTGGELAEIHPGYRRWWELRDRFDPDGRFVTADLEALRP